jgi:hypothetical protein
MSRNESTIYILFGPARIEEASEAFEKASAQADRCLAFMREVRRLERLGEEHGLDANAALDSLLDEDDCPYAETGNDDPVQDTTELRACLDNAFVDVKKVDGVGFVKELVSFWNEGTDDSNDRSDPKGSQHRKAVACGGSCHDGDPEGLGFSLAKAADIMGVTPLLGID